MQAITYTAYGPPQVLQRVDLDKPQPQADELLVRIHATTVTSGDTRLRSSDFPPAAWLIARLLFGLFRPKKQILGHELAGVVEAVGKDVTRYRVGDAVIATPTALPSGAYAEYICIPQDRKKGVLARKPSTLSFAEAAALPVGGMTALYLLDKAGLAAGQQVLIYGASGSVGSYAIQIAKAEGAEVVAVCSGANAEMVKALGADRVIDYRQEDYSRLASRFDIVFDAVGKTSKATAKQVLQKGGRFVTVKALTSPTQEHLNRLIALAEAKKITPYLDRTFPLADIVAAHEYVDQGRKRGNVAIEVVPATSAG